MGDMAILVRVPEYFLFVHEECLRCDTERKSAPSTVDGAMRHHAIPGPQRGGEGQPAAGSSSCKSQRALTAQRYLSLVLSLQNLRGSPAYHRRSSISPSFNLLKNTGHAYEVVHY
jgi:hypothetical protein